MRISAFADVQIVGGYGRVIAEPDTYRLTHQIKNCQHAEHMRLDLQLLKAGRS